MSADREPFSPDFMYETVVQTLKGLATGELWFDANTPATDQRLHNQKWRDQVAETIDRVHQGTISFFDINASPADREKQVPPLFSDILMLKAIGVLKQSLSKEEILSRLDKQTEISLALSAVMKEILVVLSDVREVVNRLDKQ